MGGQWGVLGRCRRMTHLVLSALLASAPLPLMPLPSEVSVGAGALALDGSFRVDGGSDPRLAAAVLRFTQRLTATTGIPVDPTATTKRLLTIRVKKAEAGLPRMGMDESYVLRVSAEGASLEAPQTWGALRGLETFLQLVRLGPDGFEVPAVTITDRP